ncbi:MAG: hypothetical protein AAF267_01370 [Deinococcota bacterium]
MSELDNLFAVDQILARQFSLLLLTAVGYDYAQERYLEGRIQQSELAWYDASDLEWFRLWIETNRFSLAVSVGLNLPTKEELERRIIHYVGIWLKDFGLKQRLSKVDNSILWQLDAKSVKVALDVLKRRSES